MTPFYESIFKKLYSGEVSEWTYFQYFILVLLWWFVYWAAVHYIFWQYFAHQIEEPKNNPKKLAYYRNDAENRICCATQGQISFWFSCLNAFDIKALDTPNSVKEKLYVIFFLAYNIFDCISCFMLNVSFFY